MCEILHPKDACYLSQLRIAECKTLHQQFLTYTVTELRSEILFLSFITLI